MRIAALSLVCTSAAWAQQAAGPVPGIPNVILRSETRVVLVDAVVVDKKNKFVRDLAQKDFRIWEDGKEQKISGFSLESAGMSPQRPSKHYIVLFFDLSTLSAATSLSVRQDAARFIDTFASPDRYMAVVSYGPAVQIVQNFTADPARLKAALAGMQNSSLATPGFSPLNNGPLGRGGATPPAGDASAAYRRMLAGFRNVVDSVATVRGRKALVLFSGGVNTNDDLSADVRATIDACNKANVAVYGVSGQGLIGRINRLPATRIAVLGFQRAGPGGGLTSVDASGAWINTSSSSQNQNVPRLLAAGTGGLIPGTSIDLPDALGRIAQEQDEYYAIAYTPSVESPEGSCHTLQVKVDRSGLDVRARKGYCTAKPVDLLTGKSAGRDLEARAATASEGNMSVKMQLPWFYSEPGVARVNLAMDIMPTALKFQRINNAFHAEFDLAGVASKPDGSVAARLSDTVKINLENQTQVDAFLKTPYHYGNTFEILPGKYEFRMTLGSGDKAFGKTTATLTIDPWRGSTISMSGLALSHETRPAAGLVDGLDESLLEGPHSLVSKGKEVILTGTNQYHAGERGLFYFEVYGQPAEMAGINVRVRILDRATGQQKDDSGSVSIASYAHSGSPITPILMALPTTGLQTGEYLLEVSAGAVIRTTNFELN